MPKTRTDASLGTSSNLREFIGEPSNFTSTQLPTYRDAIKQAMILQREDTRIKGYSLKEIMHEVYSLLLPIWEKANSDLVKVDALVGKYHVIDKMADIWSDARSYANNRLKKSKKKSLLDTIDSLCDILKCKCKISTCSTNNCAGCEFKAHIECTCPKEVKIPKIELVFLADQRNSKENGRKLMIALIDIKENSRMELRYQRQKKDSDRLNTTIDCFSESDQNDTIDVFSDSESDSGPRQYASTESKTQKKIYNTVKLQKVASTALRYGISDTATAALVNATLQDYGILDKENNDIIVDRSKIRRWKDKIMQEVSEFDENEKPVLGISFDGRIDKTRKLEWSDESNSFHQSIIKEEHYSMCAEPGTRYIDHFVPENKTDDETHAKQIAVYITSWIREYGYENDVIAAACDSTNVMTGWKGGVVQYLEEILNKKLIWIIFNLHTNELPLRKLVNLKIGVTKSDTVIAGNIGKLLSIVDELSTNDDFESIKFDNEIVSLPEKVINELSTDQKHAYQLYLAVTSGNLSKKLAETKCGPLNHARWLTTANRIMKLWTSCHNLTIQEKKDLKSVVQWIVCCYYPIWFYIKCNSGFLNGPYHVLKQVQYMRLLSSEIQKSVKESVQRNCYWAHSENILQTLICSEKKTDRKFAVNKIIDLRKKQAELNQTQKKDSRNKNKKNIRVRINPTLNFSAKNLTDLIDWSEALEPVLTQSISSNDLCKFIDKPMSGLPEFTTHTQSVERIVKEVTRASEHFANKDRRNGLVFKFHY